MGIKHPAGSGWKLADFRTQHLLINRFLEEGINFQRIRPADAFKLAGFDPPDDTHATSTASNATGGRTGACAVPPPHQRTQLAQLLSAVHPRLAPQRGRDH